MESILLDTNIVSYLLKKDTRAEAYRPHLEGRNALISFVTLSELLRWPIVRNWGEAKTSALASELERFQVIWPDQKTCRLWAQVVSIKGRPVNYHDAWIAAAALREDLALATHNIKNFDGIPSLRIVTA